MIKVLLLFLLFLLYSCNDMDMLKKDMIGAWVVEEVIYEDVQYDGLFFSFNVFFIEEKGNCRVPKMIGDKNTMAKWEIIEFQDFKNFSIKIMNAENEILNGRYIVSLINERGQSRMVMKSRLISITCVKNNY